MSKMDGLLRHIISKVIGKPENSIPESQIQKIKQIFEELPDDPRLTGKDAPEWQKIKRLMDGRNGANTS